MSRTPPPASDAPIRAALVLLGGPDAVVGGPWTTAEAVAELLGGAEPDLVVAADAGLHRAAAAGLHVDVVVGDLDSVDPDALAAAEASGTAVERHAEAKDHTDLALALDRARAAGVDRIVVVGGVDGRLDHLLATALVLGSPRYAPVEVVAAVDRARLRVVRAGRPATVRGQPGDLVTLLPVGGPALGVRTEGLLYRLDGEDLDTGSTRGVSNELVAPAATVSVSGGVVLAVQPGERGDHHDRRLLDHGPSVGVTDPTAPSTSSP
jgi:thiamine pyrophosphokinase